MDTFRLGIKFNNKHNNNKSLFKILKLILNEYCILNK